MLTLVSNAQGAAVVGIRGADCIILACEKKSVAKLQVSSACLQSYHDYG
jgi:20S proteasome alpha/beta subunit